MKTIFTSLIIFVVLFTATISHAITLEWDANSDAYYYIVYWGAHSGEYDGQSNKIISTVTKYESVGDKHFYFAVKAFNQYGNSSNFSNEIHDPIIDPPQNLRFKVVTAGSSN